MHPFSLVGLLLQAAYLLLTLSSQSSAYQLDISPEQINKLPEGNSQLITLFLTGCRDEDLSTNFSVTKHVVVGKSSCSNIISSKSVTTIYLQDRW